MLQCEFGPEPRFLCEWPRRELTRVWDEVPLPDFVKNCQRGVDLCGSRPIAGQYETPLGPVPAGPWWTIIIALFGAFFFFLWAMDAFHNDCDDVDDKSWCGKRNVAWDLLAYTCLIVAWVMIACTCCGNELRENPKPLGDDAECATCGGKTGLGEGGRIQPAQWFLSLTLFLFFLGIVFENGLRLVFLSDGEKAPNEPWNMDNKSGTQSSFEWLGRVLSTVAVLLLCLAISKHKKLENIRHAIREGGEVAYEPAPGDGGRPWPYRYEYERGNLDIQLPPPGPVETAVEAVSRGAGSSDGGGDQYHVTGAGNPKFNGIYKRDGDYRGSPRYKLEAGPIGEDPGPIYIRQGGSVNRGYGIHNGESSAPGAWAYFCEESRNKEGLQEVPETGWVTHGNIGARDPAPRAMKKRGGHSRKRPETALARLDDIFEGAT